MRTLVTGGAGFIGSHLADALLAAGHEVAIVDDLSRGRREQAPKGAALHVVDVTSPDLAHTIAAERPEVVFHQAAQIDVRRSVAEPLFDTTTNVLGTVNVLEACARAGVRRVVFASSGGAVYGDTEVIPTPEDHPTEPTSHYGAAKRCGEVYGGVYTRLFGLEFVALRYANVYGPRQDPHGEAGVIAIFTQRLLQGVPTTVFGDGLQTRDYVFVDDVVRANVAAAVAAETGAFNIGTGEASDVLTVHRLLADAVGVESAPAHAAAKAGEQRRSCLDVRRARAGLGWEPKVALDEGLRHTVAWFADRLPAHAGSPEGLGEQPGGRSSIRTCNDGLNQSHAVDAAV